MTWEEKNSSLSRDDPLSMGNGVYAEQAGKEEEAGNMYAIPKRAEGKVRTIQKEG